MEGKQVFRKSVMDRLSSPEELNDYLQVTRPSVWIALVAVILILAGALFWFSVTYIESFVYGTANVEDGRMAIVLERDNPFLDQIDIGQEAIVGDQAYKIVSIGARGDDFIATTETCTLADGDYPAKVRFNVTQLLEMIFN